MSVSDNKELVRRYMEEVWNEHHLERLADFISSDLLVEVSQYAHQLTAAFPDLHVTIQELISEGDKVASRTLVTGTHTGPLGDRPATGRRIEFGAFRFFRIERGMIVETWPMQDRLGLLEQLGWVEPSAGMSWGAWWGQRPRQP